MKPFRTSLFFAAVLLLLSLISLLFPQEGIGMGKEHRLTFIQISDLFRKDSTRVNDITRELLASTDLTDDPESDKGTDLFLAARAEPTLDSVSADIQPAMLVEAPDTIPLEKPYVAPANADSLKANVYRIEFRGGEDELKNYFGNLERIKSGNTSATRILHFGDSQIEVDRMTALIRYRFQKHFGGSGLGLVQAIPLYSGSMSYSQEEAGEWRRYTYFGKRDTSIKHNSYGIMGAFSSVPAPVDSTWPYLVYSFNTARRSGQIDRIRLFMHSYVDSASLAFEINDSFYDTIHYVKDGFSMADYRYPVDITRLKIAFKLPEGGRVYGISFEHSGGMQMDNIAMRGESGLLFSKMNRAPQQAMMDHLSPGLIILQYGGNVVPYMSAGYYARGFKRQLAFLRELCPATPIVVIGPADMSIREAGAFMTYPNLQDINDALRRASLESDCGFWNLFEAMGGQNSMPHFVHSNPPLASTDYVHFTPLGINLVAEMFYNALMLEYRDYKNLAP